MESPDAGHVEGELLSTRELESFNEDSELSYESPFDTRATEPLFILALFSLRLHFFFALNNLILYGMNTYELIFHIHASTPWAITLFIQIMHGIACLNIVFLCIRLIYVYNVDTFYKRPPIVAALVTAVILEACIGFLWFYGIEYRYLSVIRCYTLIWFYMRSNYMMISLVILMRHVLVYMFLLHTATCVLALTCWDCSGPENPGNTYMNSWLSYSVYWYNPRTYLTPWTWYFLSMYYVIGAVVSNGSNCMENEYELLIVIITIMASTTSTMFFISDLAIWHYYSIKKTTDFRLQVIDIAYKMRNTPLHESVKSYYWNQYGKERFVALLQYTPMIPWGLASDLILDVYWFPITQSWIFQGESKYFHRIVSQLMYTEVYFCGEFIYKYGQPLSKLYFVSHGSVGLLTESDNSGKVLNLGIGACFGDFNIIYGVNSRYALIAEDYSVLQVLDKVDFWHLINTYGFMQKKSLHDKAKNRLEFAKFKHNKRDNCTNILKKMKTLLPREDRVAIYDPRNCFKMNTFEFPYVGYVTTNIPKLETADSIFFSTNFPWKIHENITFMFLWHFILSFTVPFVHFIYLWFMFLKEDTHCLPFRFIYAVATVIFSLDVLLQLMTVSDRDHRNSSFIELVRKQLGHFTFYTDVISAIPWKWLIRTRMYPEWHLCCHVVKCIKLPVYIRKSFGRYSYFYRSYILVEFGLYICYTLQVGFTLSCISFALYRRLSRYHSYKFSMLFAQTMEFEFQVNLDDPSNIFEAICICVAAVCGLFLKVLFLGTFMAYFRLHMKQRRSFTKSMNECRIFFKLNNIPKRLQKRIMAYLQCQCDGEIYKGVLTLPEDTALETKKAWYYQYYRDILEDCLLFKGLEDELMASIAMGCTSELYPPGEVVTKGGVVVDHVHILVDGIVAMISPKTGAIHNVVGVEDRIHSLGILFTVLGIRFPYTVKACTYIRVVSVRIDHVMKVFGMKVHYLQAFMEAKDKVAAEHEESSLYVKIPTGYDSGYDEEHDTNDSWFIFPKRRSHPVHKEWKYQFDKVRIFGWAKGMLMMKTLIPDGNFLYRWEIVRACIIFINCVHEIIGYYNWDYHIEIEVWFHLIFKAYLLCDMYLQLHVCYYNSKNILVLHPRKTVRHYLRTRFAIEFIGLFPFQLLHLLAKSKYFWGELSYQSYHAIGANKYLLFIRPILEVKNSERFLHKHKILRFSIITFCCLVLLVNFQVTLLMTMTSKNVSLENVVRTRVHLLPRDEYFTKDIRTTFEFYIICLKKSAFNFLLAPCTQLMSDGYHYSFISSILGYFCFGFILSYFSSTYEVIKFINTPYIEPRVMKSYLKKFQISNRTLKALMAHANYVYMMSLQNYGLSKTTKDRLTGIIKEEIYLCLYKSTFDLVNIASFDSDIHRQLAKHLNEVHYNNVDIFEVNDIIATIYIVKEGNVVLTTGGGHKIATLTKGSIFGNFDSVKIIRSMVTATCSGYVTLLEMKTTTFYELIDSKLEEALEEYITSNPGNISYIPGYVTDQPKKETSGGSIFLTHLNNFMSSHYLLMQVSLAVLITLVLILVGVCIFMMADAGITGTPAYQVMGAFFITISWLCFRGQAHCPSSGNATLMLVLYMIISRILIIILVSGAFQMAIKICQRGIVYRYNQKQFTTAVAQAKASYRFNVLIRDHVERCWMHCQGLFLDDVLERVPRPLVHEVKMEIFGRGIVRHPLWRGCHPAFLRQLIGYIKVRPYFNRDTICREGSMDATMYFILSGWVELSMLNSSLDYVIDVLQVGDIFGVAPGLYPTTRHMYTFTSKNVAEVAALSFRDWKHLLNFFPATKFIIYENYKLLLTKQTEVRFNLGRTEEHSSEEGEEDEDLI